MIRILPAIAVAVLAMTACGGDDDATGGSNTDPAPATDDADAPADADEPTTTPTAPTATTPATATTPSDGESTTDDGSDDAGADDAGDDGDDDGGDDPFETSGDAVARCEAIFGQDEMDELFGEPSALEASTNDSLGQTMCAWATVDEADDDLAGAIVTVQVFSGDPIPAANFIDPDIFDEVTMIDGVGDLAFSEESFGTNFYFLDEPIAGSLGYSEFALGDPDAPARRSPDELTELFRTFHERVT